MEFSCSHFEAISSVSAVFCRIKNSDWKSRRFKALIEIDSENLPVEQFSIHLVTLIRKILEYLKWYKGLIFISSSAKEKRVFCQVSSNSVSSFVLTRAGFLEVEQFAVKVKTRKLFRLLHEIVLIF